jgi:hypothetical protein
MGGSSFVRSTESISESILMPPSWEMDWPPHLKARTKNPMWPFQYCERVSTCTECKTEFRIQGSGVEGGKWWVEMVCGKDFGVGESPFAGSWSGYTVPSWPSSDYSRMRGNTKSNLSRWLEIVITCEGGCGK